MKFTGIVNQGVLAIPPEQQRLKTQYLASMPDATQVIVDIKVLRASKSNKQLGAYFGLFCRVVLEEFNERGWDTSYIYKLDKPTGIEVSEEELKDYMYSVCPVFKDGKRLRISKMDTTEMASFFDKCITYASSQWQIYVPDPDPNWRKARTMQ